jgi:hypothetical protein
MRRQYGRALTICLSVLVGSSALVSMWAPADRTRTEDRNRDGRPDVWRSYARDGRVARIAVDTNFDGRSDVEEYYENGALVRRESDRDFNDQIDLVQDFDRTTQQIVRSVSDVNSDGVADLLVLFQDGRPVYSKWAQTIRALPVRAVAATGTSRKTHQPLTSLSDPFSGDVAFKAIRVAPETDDSLGLPAPMGMPPVSSDVIHFATASPSIAFDDQSASSTLVDSVSLRGPPALPFLT